MQPNLFPTPLLKQFYANKMILITGGKGHIATHLHNALTALNAYVTLLDIAEEPSPTSDRYISGSITELPVCLDATQDIDIVFHTAAITRGPYSHIYKTNVTGTINLLEACKINKVGTLVFSSSAAVYGEQKTACRENFACEPISLYGASKLAAENYCQLYSTICQLRIICLRYFNVYHETFGLLHTLSSYMKQNRPIDIFGNGTQVRDFVHVDQVVLTSLLLLLANTPKCATYNVGSGQATPLLQIVDKLKSTFPNSKSIIRFHPKRECDIYHSVADCSKLDHTLDSLLNSVVQNQ
ncbi:NAD-dependent epimerase/dehydratase family protein [Candidatus Babeliales bacterium]|nr:NAD-dependent epimerase/dehydratase family protein [Candidatus Babeliales bacterium]